MRYKYDWTNGRTDQRRHALQTDVSTLSTKRKEPHKIVELDKENR